MSFGKGSAGAAFEITFELACFGFIGEREVADQAPGPALDRRRVLSGIVRGESCAKIVGESGVVTTVVDPALEKVHVVHGPSTLKRGCGGKFAEYPDFGDALAGNGAEPRPAIRSKTIAHLRQAYGGQPPESHPLFVGRRESAGRFGLPAVGLAEAGGGGGIRTPGELTPTSDFKSGALNHSATPPWRNATRPCSVAAGRQPWNRARGATRFRR